MSCMGLADAKAFSLENDRGWRRKSSWGMGTNAGFESCCSSKQFLGVPIYCNMFCDTPHEPRAWFFFHLRVQPTFKILLAWHTERPFRRQALEKIAGSITIMTVIIISSNFYKVTIVWDRKRKMTGPGRESKEEWRNEDMKRSVKTLYSQFHQDELFIYRTKPEGDIDHSTNHRNKNVTPSYRESTVISPIKLRLVLDSRLVVGHGVQWRSYSDGCCCGIVVAIILDTILTCWQLFRLI